MRKRYMNMKKMRKILLPAILLVTIMLMMTVLTGCGKEEAAQPQEETVALDTMPVSEFNRISEEGKLDYMNQVKDIFGSPDATATEDGRIVWLHFDRLHTDSGTTQSIRFVFYTKEELIEYYKKLGHTPDDDDLKEDKVVVTERRAKEDYKQKYGIK